MSSGRVREKRPLDGFPVCAASPSLIWSDVISLQGRESDDGVWSFPLAHLESNLETFVGLLINKALPAPSLSIFCARAVQRQSQQSSWKSRVRKSQEALTLTLMKDTPKSVGSYFQLPVRSRFSTLFRCRLHFPNRRLTLNSTSEIYLGPFLLLLLLSKSLIWLQPYLDHTPQKKHSAFEDHNFQNVGLFIAQCFGNF